MKTLQIHYPDTLPDVVRMSDEEFQKDAAVALACKLFEMGRLSSGQAAQMAGLTRYEFLRGLSAYRVSAIDWDLSELDKEIENA